MRTRQSLTGTVLAALLCTAAAFAQSDPLTFEVASVKPSIGCPPACGLIRSTVGSQGYHAEGATVRSLMTIEAKAARQRPTDELHVMLRHLIEERFNLKLRRETREESVWALVVAKGGSKIPVHDPNDKDYAPIGLKTIGASDGVCFAMPGRNVTMNYFAFMLSRVTNRPVIDKTGLPAHYDVDLQFVPDGLHASGPDGRPQALSPDCADVFFALPKQLGLNLQATKAPVEYLVVEHVDKPTEN